MKNIQELSALIQVRNYAAASIDNLSIKLTNPEVRLMQNKVSQLDRQIVAQILESGSLEAKPVLTTPKQPLAKS